MGNFGSGEKAGKSAVGHYDNVTPRAHVLGKTEQNKLPSPWLAAVVHKQNTGHYCSASP
jgi:hypothetical protein